MKLIDLSNDLGTKLTSYSRKVLEEYINNSRTLEPLFNPEILEEKAGIFCTLRKNKQLRGCIGFHYPSHKLGDALVKSTIQAAVHDPRFNPVKPSELNQIEIELTVLTPPELIKVRDSDEYVKIIKIGIDGLIIESGQRRGLLLPQVPVEQQWTIEEFLEGICHKAYLDSNAWQDIKNTKLYKFNGKIFEE